MGVNEDGLEDYSALVELGDLLNEAWANGYIDGYVSVIRKQPDYCKHREGYVGRLLEEYESGYSSAIYDNVKWTRKYAWARGYLDGLRTSKLEWNEFGFLAFWANEYTGELLDRYNDGYYDGFFENYSKQRDYEWALGFLNQLRNLQARINILPRIQLVEKNYHDDHGYLHYPFAYEEGFEKAKTFCQYASLAEAESALDFTNKIQWIIGYIDGKYHRKERFELRQSDKKSSRPETIFDDFSFAYHEGYEVGTGHLFYEKSEMGMKSWEYNSCEIRIERSKEEIDNELIWGTGYVDGRMYGISRYRGYNDSEKAIYQEGFDIGFSELKQEKQELNNNAYTTLYSAEYKGRSDANNYRCMFNHGYDRVRFHAYRKGFYSEMLFSLIHPDYLSNKEYTQDEIRKYLRSFKVPTSNIYINNKLEAWKLGVKSGFTGNSARPNNDIFFCAEYDPIYGLNDDSFAHNIESDLYDSYKEGCRFGYEHTSFYRWNFAYDSGFSDGEDYASERANVKKDSRSNFKGYELEAYDKGFSDALDFVEKSEKQADDNSSYEWTMEDAWDAMTDGMYGDYKGDVDFDKFGF